ncbi:hypothetical protein Tco_0320892 [Tanacetum coccineum]
MEKAGKQQEMKYTITSSDTAKLQEFYQKRTLFETMTKTKSFDRNPKHRDLYHALMESILKDEDAMDKGVADKLKKRKPDDADKDEGPPVGPDQGKSTQAEETVFETADTQVPQNLEEDMGPVYNLLKSTCKSYAELEYNIEECYKALNDELDWNNPEGYRYPFYLSKPLPLVKSRNHKIVLAYYLFNNDSAYMQGGSTDRTYTTYLTKTKAAKYDVKGIEYMDILHDMATNLRMGYNKAMPKRRWSNLDKTQSHIIVKEIDRQLLERRLMRSLEKFVGGREYREDLRLLQRTI